MDVEYVIAYVGSRGSGKSLALSWSALMAMIGGMECHSNIPILAGGDDYNEGILEATPLNTLELFSFSERMKNAYLVIDEFQMFAASKDTMTNKSRLFGWLGQQIRKRGLTIGYSVQDIKWIDGNWQYQTDIIVQCRDLYHTPWGREHGLGRGEEIHLAYWDKSGKKTGMQYQATGRPFYECNLYSKPVWDWYDSFAHIGMDEAFRRFEIARQTYVVGQTKPDGGEEYSLPADMDFSSIQPQVDGQAIVGAIVQKLRQDGVEKIDATDFRRLAREGGCADSPIRLGQHMASQGVTAVREYEHGKLAKKYIIPDAAR
jgi:hypothetical protein